MKHTQVLNIQVLAITEQELLENMKEGVLITPNLNHLVKLQKDREFYECYKKAEWVVCDSRTVFSLGKLLKPSLPEVIPGSGFFPHFYEYHKDDPDCRIFLLGGLDGVADLARKKINEKIGREIVVGSYSPSYGFEKKQEENEAIYKMIEDCKATVVLVGVGAPKQEKWIMAHKDKMPNVKIWMALGATIDFEAGKVKRAPVWMQKLGIEFVYRISKEPKRLLPRFIREFSFFWYFFKQLIGIYKDPFAEKE